MSQEFYAAALDVRRGLFSALRHFLRKTQKQLSVTLIHFG